LKSLLERFRSRPEWQSPDPVVRAEAVLRLPSSELDALLTIAREDPEARVRRAAARKLDDLETLTGLATSDEDADVREEAASRLVHVATHAKAVPEALSALGGLREARHLVTVAREAGLAPAREAAVAALSDPRALAAVVREAEDGPTRLLALGRIDDASTLLALALKCDQKAVAVAAVERLVDPDALREVAEKARASAAVRRARALLEAAEPAPPPAEGAAPSSGAEDEEAREREAYERARAEQEREAAARAGAIAARASLCASVEAAEGEAIPAAVDKGRARWDTLAPLPGPDSEAVGARFERAVAEAGRRHEAWKAGLARRDELEALAVRAEELAGAEDLVSSRAAWDALRREWTGLQVTADQPDLRVRFDAARGAREARERAAHDEHEKRDRETLARQAELAERAEALLAAEEPALRDVDHALREVKAALEHPGHFPTRRDREELLGRLEAVRGRLYLSLQQLRVDADWKRWVNVDVQEELCARAEALLEETDLDKAARELRDLDFRWKQAKEAPKEKAEELWRRFRGARDAVRERVEAHFAAQAEALAENLRRKEVLCEKAEALAESTEWSRTAEELRCLQAEWKQVGPVPRAQSRRIWQRFRQPCDRFFTRFQEHRAQRGREWTENLARKEALCEKAEALQDSTDWEGAAADLKRLQAEWRTIGAVKKSRSEAIWQRFRAACDHFFERYKHRDTLAVEAVRESRERICADLEALAPGDGEASAPREDLVARVQAAQTAWRQAGELPTDLMASLHERFDRARHRLVELFPRAFAGSELDPEASRRRAEKLIARVEGLVQELAPGATGAAATSAEELAARLRDALAANTMGGHAAAEARWHSATAEVEAAQNAWRRLGPIPGPGGQALLERFDGACRRFFELRPRLDRPRSGTGRRSRTRA
jgi:Domain of Unknown Function (DUF349)